ncbi:MAG: BREX-1 system phosphatase PglZ type A [Oscillospiraceae bacterium]|jgi:uncharacterized protein (TIGR02687 family)|nr:BREX-1 system phosphatase PglZ type A [Oscillospiraceae bacterium]
MPSLDLKQITDKLKAEFTEDTRKIVFWYDDAAEFVDEIESFDIGVAKLHILTLTNQFSTKYLLERQDIDSNYLIYAPFSKPDVRDNALEDILLYSRRFYADRASLLAVDLRIEEKYKPVVQKHIKFFAAKDRTQRFYDFEIETFTKETIEIAMMSALCKIRTASFEEVLRVVLTSGLDDNPYLDDFEKYDLLTSFWDLCNETLGYKDTMPNLIRLIAAMFIVYASRQLNGELPKAWEDMESSKSGSIITFLDNLMNSIIYRSQYDELAKYMASILNIRDAFANNNVEVYLDCDAFHVFDEFIIKWITERLLDEDVGATVADQGITNICKMRMKKHFGDQYATQYNLLSAAYEIICLTKYQSAGQFNEIVKQYILSDYMIDTHYRRFYVEFDRLPEADSFEKLRTLVESIYTIRYLGNLLPAFSASLNVKASMRDEMAQLRFFDKKIKPAKDKTVVIISDALRYEVGCELFEKLKHDQNCTVDINHMLGVLPTYTQLGMAALLPHKTLEITPDAKVIVDGKQSDSTEKREAILQSALPESRCVRYNRFPIKRDDLREIFTGMDVVYIYHDNIDNRGSATEDDVFASCKDAVEELFTLIKRLSGSANVYRFIVTADHGFLYKRDRFTESEKINFDGKKEIYANRRFIIGDEEIKTDGVMTVPLSDVVGGDDKRFVSFPIGAGVFKTHGGLKYVHGGASPQEMIIPLISVKTEKGHVDTQPAVITLVSMVRKITNLITRLDFIQSEPVNDIVKEADYKLYFISESGEKISDEQIYHANSKDTDPNKRMFSLKFNFKNISYEIVKHYYLVAVNSKTGVELFRHQVIMDIAFADGVGFGF